MTPIVAVDFDGTCVEHRYPDLGPEVTGAVLWLKRFVDAGIRIILWTMRSPIQSAGVEPFEDAVDWFKVRNIPLYGINENPEQSSWSTSPKAYAQLYIDDLAIGCPLVPSKQMGAPPMVDWAKVGPLVFERFGIAVPT